MKVFWADREGGSPPLSATFYWRPFAAKTTSPLQTERILTLPAPTEPIEIRKKTLTPEYPAWQSNILAALQLIEQGELQKIVLARTCTLELAETPDPFAITAALQQKAKGAYVFCFQWEDKAFLGASPERLFCKQNRLLQTEAVAGTRPRGKDEREDLFYQKQLLESEKDRREIAPVVSYLQNQLTPLCHSCIDTSSLSIHSTQNVHHLYQKLQTSLKERVSDEEILDQIHPTPALCGWPKQQAFSQIQSFESFERGLYGGVLGWKTESSSEWIVGIRSCFLQGNKATLYTGTGIVKGSLPQLEWEELNTKLQLYQSIFTNL